MKLTQMISRCWQVYRSHFGDLMKGTMIQLVLCLLVATPLLFLASSQTAFLALLTPVLFLLIILPARQNSAEAMRDMLHGGNYATIRLVSTRQYGRKLLRGLRQAGFLLLWALPLLAATVVILLAYYGMVDAFTLFRILTFLGGKFTQGVVVALLLYLTTLLPVLLGMAMLSWRRHGDARELSRHAIRGQRSKLLAVNLLGVLTLVPFLVAAVLICRGYFSALVTALTNIATSTMTLPPLSDNLWMVAVAFVVLFLPLSPLKSLLPAVLVDTIAEAPAKAAEAVQA